MQPHQHSALLDKYRKANHTPTNPTHPLLQLFAPLHWHFFLSASPYCAWLGVCSFSSLIPSLLYNAKSWFSTHSSLHGWHFMCLSSKFCFLLQPPALSTLGQSFITEPLASLPLPFETGYVPQNPHWNLQWQWRWMPVEGVSFRTPWCSTCWKRTIATVTTRLRSSSIQTAKD